MRPTSPRGIMPTPTVTGDTPGGTTRPHAHLPTQAATVRRSAKSSRRASRERRDVHEHAHAHEEDGNEERGQRHQALVQVRLARSACPSKCASSSTSPAANAPTIAARPASSARTSRKHQPRERASTTPRLRRARARRKSRGERNDPTRARPPGSRTPWPRSGGCPPRSRAVPRGGGLDDPGDHREHEQPQHVVDHRRARE